MSATQPARIKPSQEELDRMSTAELLNRYKSTKDEAYKWPLVLRYTELIKSAALQIRGVYSSFAQVDDILHEGILVLFNAIDKFDPDKGVKFETYVAKRIRGMVIDLARKQDWMPRNVRRRAKEIDQATSQLYSELGRFPSDEEIAAKLEIPVEKYQKDVASAAMGSVLSLDALMELQDMDRGRFELPAEEGWGEPEAALEDRELQSMLAQAISSLRENEQIVLSLYYEKNLHMKEIAQVMEVSEPRISQLHARAVQKLRTYMKAYLSGAPAPKHSNRKKE